MKAPPGFESPSLRHVIVEKHILAGLLVEKRNVEMRESPERKVTQNESLLKKRKFMNKFVDKTLAKNKPLIWKRFQSL